jgi:hypothetical protein
VDTVGDGGGFGAAAHAGWSPTAPSSWTPQRFTPENKEYAMILKHIGGLKPGEAKLVKPRLKREDPLRELPAIGLPESSAQRWALARGP